MFTVPAGITGCGVPLVVQINDQVSNFTTMAIASNGRVCVAEASTLPPGLLQQFAGKSRITIGTIGLVRTVSVAADGTTAKADAGTAIFTKYNIPATTYLTAAYSPPVPYNSCLVNSVAGSATPPPFSGSLPVYLDAGPALAVAGPNGARTLPKLTATSLGTYYSAGVGNATPGNYLDSDHYTVTGAGGPLRCRFYQFIVRQDAVRRGRHRIVADFEPRISRLGALADLPADRVSHRWR